VIEYCVLRGISLFIKLGIDIPSEGKAIVQLINVKLSSLSKCEGWRGCIQFTNWYMTALKFSLSLSLSLYVYIYTQRNLSCSVSVSFIGLMPLLLTQLLKVFGKISFLL
jgi:hypothetical protein